nr:MAG TPA: Type I restriction enzyme [Caudoviricetes sp.]
MALVDYDPNKHGQAVSGLKDYLGFTAQDAEAAKDDSALTRGFKNSFRSARMAWNDFTNDRDELAQLAAEDADYKAIQAAKQTKARKELGEAWDKGDGITGGLANVGNKFADDWKKKGFVGALQNIDGMTDALLEQAPNAVIPLATTAAGAFATGGAGAAGGAALGNTAMEYGEQFSKAAQAAGVDVHDKEALDKFIRTGSGGALGKAALKGSTIGVVDALTAGVGGKILNAGAKAAEKAVLKEMGVDLANKGFVSAVKRSPEFAAKLAEKGLVEASQKGFGNAARHAGAFALEPVGEFAGEYLGSGIANNEWDAKGAALEAFASLGQSAVQFVGTKAYAVATDPLKASKAQIKDALQESQNKLTENVKAGKLTEEEAQVIQLGVQAAIDGGIEQGGKGLDTAHSEQREQSFEQFKDRLSNQEADEVFRTAAQSPAQQNSAPSQTQESAVADNGSEQTDVASQSDIELLGGNSKVDSLVESREQTPANEVANDVVKQTAVPDIKPSERMGLNANDGALSAAAVIAVDSAAQKPASTANAVATNTPSAAAQSAEAQNFNSANQESEYNSSQIQPTSSAEERVLPTSGARTGSAGRTLGGKASTGGSVRVTPLPTADYFNNLDSTARKALAKNAGFNINGTDSFETLGRRVQRKIEADYHARVNADHQAANNAQEGRLPPPVRMADAVPVAKANFSRPADALNKQNRAQFDKLPADIQHHAERVADYTADGIMRQEAGMPDMRRSYPKSVMESVKAIQAYRASNPDSAAVLDSLNRSVYGYRRNNSWSEPLLSRDGEAAGQVLSAQDQPAAQPAATGIPSNTAHQAANAQADNAVPPVSDIALSVEQAKNQPDLQVEPKTEQATTISSADNLAKVDGGITAPAAGGRTDTVLPVLNPQAVELAAKRLPANQAEVFRKSADGIADFVNKHNRMPSENATEKTERKLAKQAKTINEILKQKKPDIESSAKEKAKSETRTDEQSHKDSVDLFLESIKDGKKRGSYKRVLSGVVRHDDLGGRMTRDEFVRKARAEGMRTMERINKRSGKSEYLLGNGSGFYILKEAEYEYAKFLENNQTESVKFSRSSSKNKDAEYLDLANRYRNGDESVKDRLREMVNERAMEAGYGKINPDEIQGWAAPSDDGYTQAERWEMIDDGDSVDFTPEDIAYGYSLQPQELFFGNASGLIPRNKISYDSLNAIKRAVHEMKRQIDANGRVVDMPFITVYRAIPKGIKAGSLRNRDWVSPSKDYAISHGHIYIDGDYRIQEAEVPANHLWWDGNDINEWGYDNGRDVIFKNTKNNIKSNELITLDDNGEIIPLSKRFNTRKADERFSRGKNKQGNEQHSVNNHVDDIKSHLSKTLGYLSGRVDVVSVLESMPRHAKKLITGRVEGWFNGKTGSITLAAENLTPERAVWVAWHELGHRGFARASWAKYSETLKSLDKNLIVRKIADAIQKDRAGLDDKAASVRAVAVEEALVELYAAERTGNWAELAERYNVAGLSRVNGVAEDNVVIKSVKAAIKRFADAIRRSLARLLRKEYSAKVAAMSDKEILNLLSDLHELNMNDDSTKQANNDGKKFSFAGQKAYTADVGKFSEAEKLEKDGKTDKEIWEQTGWFKGKDGKWRFEIDDSQAELSISKEDADKRASDTGFNAFMANVEDFLSHDSLFVAYPEIRNLAVFYDNRPMANGKPLRGAAYQSERKTITIGGGLRQDEMKSSLLHEIQHHIQRIEGYARGGSPEIFEKTDRDIKKDGYSDEAKEMYKRLAGEVEARNVQFRREMGMAERGKSYPRATEDVMDDLQNVMFSRAANARMENILASVTGNASDLKEAIRDKWDASKGAQLQLLGRRQITDIYGDILDGLKEYERLSELFGADSNMAMVEADKVVKKWGKLKKDDAKQLADLMHDATLSKVDADPERKGAVTKRLNAIRTALDIADNRIEKSKAIIAAANPIIARAESAYNKAEKAARKAETALLAAEEKAGREILADEKDERLRRLFYINSEAKRALEHANAEWMKAAGDKSEAVKTLKESRADIKRLEKEEVEAQEAITKSVELNRRFNRLSEQAKEVYRKARDDYKAHFEKVRDAVAERMELAGQDDAIIQRLKERFDNELGGVYFPLARFGDYLVVVKDAEGKNVNVSRAETLSEAEKIRSALKADFKEGFTVSNVMKSKDYIQSRDAVSNGFMKELNDAIGVMDLDPSQQAELNDTLTQLYLNSLPDTSWAKHGIHRKGVAGFSDDARRAYAQNMSSGASYLSKLIYADRMAEQLDVMQNFIEAHKYDEGFEQRQLQRVADEMRKRHDAVMNPTPSKMAQALTSFGFLWMMGMSPASAIVNLSQTAMIAYPVMASKWGYANAARELLKASKQISTGFKGRKFNSEKFNTIEDSLNDDEKAAFKKAVDYGVIDLSQAHDLAGVANGEQSKLGTAWQKVMDKASWMFHHAEKFNRQVTFVAAYRLAKQAGADSNTAFEQAKKATYDGHFDYSSQNRPRFMMGNVAKVVFLFKQYSQNILYALGRNAYLSFKGDKEARKTLAGILVTHAMASGVLGLPFVTTMLAIASALGSDDDDPWDAEAALRNTLSDTFGNAAGEVIAKGFSRLTPLDVSGRLGLNQLIFPDIQDGLDGKKWAESLVVGSTGAVVGAGINAADGMQKIVDGRYLEGLEGMLPAAIRNPLKAIRYGLDGQVDKSGIVIKDDFDPFELAGQAIGFRSSDLALKQEGKSAIYQRDRSLSAARTKILSAMAKAVMDNDLSAMEKLRDVIVQWNSKNPDRPIRIENIKTSVRNRQRRISGAENGIYIPESRRAAREAGNFAFDEE